MVPQLIIRKTADVLITSQPIEKHRTIFKHALAGTIKNNAFPFYVIGFSYNTFSIKCNNQTVGFSVLSL